MRKGTGADPDYIGSQVLYEEQKSVRGETKQPFWANYFCGRDKNCQCRIEGSRALESDAIFFFRNHSQKILAVHIEFKRVREPFDEGQAESYPLRAKCFAEGVYERRTLNKNDDFICILFCGDEKLSDKRISYFDKVITHDEARKMISDYPLP